MKIQRTFGWGLPFHLGPRKLLCHHRRGIFVQSLWLKPFLSRHLNHPLCTVKGWNLSTHTAQHPPVPSAICICAVPPHTLHSQWTIPLCQPSGILLWVIFCSHNQLCASLAGWFVSVRMGKAFSGTFQTSFSLKSLIPVSIMERYITVFEVVSLSSLVCFKIRSKVELPEANQLLRAADCAIGAHLYQQELILCAEQS